MRYYGEEGSRRWNLLRFGLTWRLALTKMGMIPLSGYVWKIQVVQVTEKGVDAF